MRRVQGACTLDATELVNEACARILASDHSAALLRVGPFVAKVMRNLLRDHADRRNARKRGGGLRRVSFHSGLHSEGNLSYESGDLDEALSKLEAAHPVMYRALELTYFGGLDQGSVARLMDVSDRSVRTYLRGGTAWLKERLGPAAADAP